MEVQTTHGKIKLPKTFKGKWFILFSHPADFTPVCTTEFYAFQSKYQQFKDLNCELIGLSIDQIYSHLKWIEWIKDNLALDIEFPVIADTGEIAKTLGIIHPAKAKNTVRAVFIIDPTGIIRAILYYPPELGRNIDEILRMVEGFNQIERKQVEIPANWPKIIGKGLIIPPIPNIEEGKKRADRYKCIDWWLCYRNYYRW